MQKTRTRARVRLNADVMPILNLPIIFRIVLFAFYFLIFLKNSVSNTLLIIVSMINIPATDVSSFMPFIFNMITMAISAIVKIIVNTRKTGLKIKPNWCFLISNMEVIMRPGKAIAISNT